MTRTYGLSSDPVNTSTNSVVTQADGTNFPSMVADVNAGGPASVRYIHIRGSQSFTFNEVFCYERRRLTKDEFLEEDHKKYIIAENGALANESESFPAWYTEALKYTDSKDVQRLVILT